MLGAMFSDAEPMPVPDRYLLFAIAAWSGWSTASIAWSIQPAYTRAEIGTEIGWGLATATIFYVAARNGAAFRALLTTAVGVCAVLAVLALVEVCATGSNGESSLVRSHGGVGAYSTYLVLVSRCCRCCSRRAPVGYRHAPFRPCVATAAGFVLMLVAARITENRMIWIALAAGSVLVAAIARGVALARTPRSRAPALDRGAPRAAGPAGRAVRRRRRCSGPAPISPPTRRWRSSIAEDPRFALWTAHVRAHPRATVDRLRLRQVDPARGAARRPRQPDARACAQHLRQPVAANRCHRRARAARMS